jgi:hypothetical protein
MEITKKLTEWRNRMDSIAQRLPFESEKKDVHSMLKELDEIIVAAGEGDEGDEETSKKATTGKASSRAR